LLIPDQKHGKLGKRIQDAWLLHRTGLVSKKNETKGKVIWRIPTWTKNKHLKASQKEKLPWKNPSKCASPAPDGAFSALSGDLKSHSGKAKPIVRWGGKATGLNYSCF